MQKAEHRGKTSSTIIQALIDLYLNVKVRSAEEIENYNEDKLEEEREVLLDTDPLVIIEYIKTSIEILLNLKEEEQGPNKKLVDESVRSEREIQENYEQQIQKLEAETRMHIRVEQQLKLHIDSIQAKLEENEKTMEKMKVNMKKVEAELLETKERIKRKTTEAEQWKKVLDEKTKKLTGLEEKLKSVEMEKKIRNSTIPVKGVHHNMDNTIFHRTSQIPLEETVTTEKTHHSGHSPGKKRIDADTYTGKRASTSGRNTHSRASHYTKENPKHTNTEEVEKETTQTRLKMKYTKIEAELDSKRVPTAGEKPGSSYAHLRSKSHRGDDYRGNSNMAAQYKKYLNNATRGDSRENKGGTQFIQRNSSIENIIKALERQITKGNNKSRIPTSNRPNTTYRERPTGNSYIKTAAGNNKLGTTAKLTKSIHNSSSHMRSSTTRGGPL